MEHKIDDRPKGKIRAIYTFALARHLAVDKGLFNYLKRIVKDRKDESKNVWLFFESDEVKSAINEYLSNKN